MALEVTTKLRNDALDGIKGSLDLFNLKLYAGTVPDTAEADCTASTLLCTIYVANDGATLLTFDAAASGVLKKAAAEVWSGTNVASGTASFFRCELAADDQLSDPTQPRFQGTVGEGGSDLNLTSAVLTLSAVQTIDNFNIALPTL